MYFRFYNFGTCTQEMKNDNWNCLWNNCNINGWNIREEKILKQFGTVITLTDLIESIRNQFLETEISILEMETEYNSQIKKLKKQHENQIKEINNNTSSDVKDITLRLEQTIKDYKKQIQELNKGHKKELKIKNKIISDLKESLSDKNELIEKLENSIYEHKKYIKQFKCLEEKNEDLTQQNIELTEKLNNTIKIYDIVIAVLSILVISFAVFSVLF